MRICILFEDSAKIITGNMSLNTVDRFIDHCGDTIGFNTPYNVKELDKTQFAIADGNGKKIVADRYFHCTVSDFPFCIYWPQEIAEKCGVPCFGEEYA